MSAVARHAACAADVPACRSRDPCPRLISAARRLPACQHHGWRSAETTNVCGAGGGAARCRAARRVRTNADGSTSSQAATVEAGDAAPERLSISIRGVDALRGIKLDLVGRGKGQAVLVTDVDEGSPAEQAGVRKGQRMVAISDPVRYGTMWELEDRPSLRFVVDTLKMKRNSAIQLQFEPMMEPQEVDKLNGVMAAPQPADGGAEGAAAGYYSGSGSDTDNDAASGSMSDADLTIASIDQTLGGSGSDSEAGGGGGGRMTIGERLAAQYEESERAKMGNNEVQKRIQRRKEYMAIDEERNDFPLLLTLTAVFVAPALIILAIAYGSGYLDNLYSSSLTLR